MSADWRPTASLAMLRRRAALLETIRSFFAERGVLEVETPVLAAHGVTDAHLTSLSTTVRAGDGRRTAFLQTSPEYAMKRLIAAGSGPIFQMAKAFRDQERGRFHHPEFTLLEWYRPGFDHRRLMDEVEALLTATLGTPEAERRSYRALFGSRLGIDPHRASRRELAATAQDQGVAVAASDLDRDAWLGLLMTHCLEPGLGHERPLFVYDYPAGQAALARLRNDGAVSVAERFEVYVEGVELANGFHELGDAVEQRSRFETDRTARHDAGLAVPAIDERLLAALEHGIGDCAGVALGIDRLLMLQTGAEHIDQVIGFPIERA